MLTWTRFKQLFAPPTFADESQSRAAALLNIILIATTLVNFASMIENIVRASASLVSMSPYIAFLCLQVWMFVPLRRGYIRSLSWVFLLLGWAVLSSDAYMINGILNPIFSGYVLIILIAGLLLGGRVAFIFAGMSVISAAYFVYAAGQGSYPEQFGKITVLQAFIDYAAIFAMVAVLLFLGLRSLNQALARAERELAQRKAAEEALRLSQEALRQNEERWRSVIENMPVMLDAFDEQGNVVVWNQECERVTGFSAAEIVRNPAAMQFMYPDADYLAQMIKQWTERGNNYRNWEWDITIKGGHTKTIAWSNISERFPIPGWASWGIGVDVTEQRQAEKALQQQHEILQTVFDCIPVMIIVRDEAGRIELVNSEWERIMGWTLDDMQHLDLMEATYPDPTYRQQAVDYMQAAKPGWRDFKNHTKSGVTVDTSWANVRFSDGSSIGIGQDMTQRKKAEEHIRYAQVLRAELEKEREINDVKSRFISITSHEFRTPLAAIQLSSSTLKMYYDRMDKAQRAKHFQRIEDRVQHMTQLLEDLLAMARHESGSVQFQPTWIDLKALCEEVADDLRYTQRTHTLIYNCVEDCSEAFVDEKLIRQIVTNLLTNAIKYSPEGSTVQFDLRCADDQLLLTVQDQGIGIPKADQARLFQPFHRATNAEAIAGTGLGLAITRQAVELHGGSINFESKIGEGTQFSVTIPLSGKRD